MIPDCILIVDPEPKWVSLTSQILTTAGYAVAAANKGERAIQLLEKERPALVLMESQLLDDMNGFEFIHSIREFSDIPVIMLASSSKSEDILHGFDAGADDYITKPFDAKILLARMRAVLNRYRGRMVMPAEIVCNNLVINQANRGVTLDGVEVYLTETEFNLLIELARHSDQVLLHEQLLVAVWGVDFRNELDYLRSYIHILRRKLERDPANPRLIISRPGIGYMLVSNHS
jgi:two-component system, OmpR family, KDP operon response regulator KdpE